MPELIHPSLPNQTPKLPAMQKPEPGPIAIVQMANSRLKDDGRFSNHSESIQVDFQEGRLVLTGRVPSFYLRSVLQTVLDGLPGVRLIDNQVDVVSCMGLSSTHERYDPGGQGPLGCRT